MIFDNIPSLVFFETQVHVSHRQILSHLKFKPTFIIKCWSGCVSFIKTQSKVRCLITDMNNSSPYFQHGWDFHFKGEVVVAASCEGEH